MPKSARSICNDLYRQDANQNSSFCYTQQFQLSGVPRNSSNFSPFLPDGVHLSTLTKMTILEKFHSKRLYDSREKSALTSFRFWVSICPRKTLKKGEKSGRDILNICHIHVRSLSLLGLIYTWRRIFEEYSSTKNIFFLLNSIFR